ncbi:hypothetical protein E2562_013866, partial [Oryza meyeriana var. granulata]
MQISLPPSTRGILIPFSTPRCAPRTPNPKSPPPPLLYHHWYAVVSSHCRRSIIAGTPSQRRQVRRLHPVLPTTTPTPNPKIVAAAASSPDAYPSSPERRRVVTQPLLPQPSPKHRRNGFMCAASPSTTTHIPRSPPTAVVSGTGTAAPPAPRS